MFLETIYIRNGVVQNLQGHIQRMKETAAHFDFTAPALPEIAESIPLDLKNEKVKCRLLYRDKIFEIQFEKYLPKPVHKLKLVEAAPDYSFKFADRQVLNEFLAHKGDCDEILIVRDGFITDSSYSNVVFRKNNEFYTPSTYLLNGTKRQKLLREKKIKEMEITVRNVFEFEELFFINAMLDVEDGIGVSINKSTLIAEY